MTELMLYGAFGLLLLAAIVKLLVPAGSDALSARGEPAEFFPKHCRYFPQMRQLFSLEDAAYLAARSSPALLRRWKAERKGAARLYLRSLQEDFAGLNRLARTLARYSAHLDPRQQARVFWLNGRFQLLYYTAQVQIQLGLAAGAELQRMAYLVGNLGGSLEKAAFTLDSTSGALTL